MMSQLKSLLEKKAYLPELLWASIQVLFREHASPPADYELEGFRATCAVRVER